MLEDLGVVKRRLANLNFLYLSTVEVVKHKLEIVKQKFDLALFLGLKRIYCELCMVIDDETIYRKADL